MKVAELERELEIELEIELKRAERKPLGGSGRKSRTDRCGWRSKGGRSVCVREAKEVGGVASTSCGRTDNVSLEGALSAPALPARCLGLRRRRETARQRRAGSERRRGGEAAHTPDRPSLGPPRSPASLRQARRTGQHDQCTVAPLKLGATPARSPQSICGRPPAAEAVATPSEAAATPAIWHSGALVGACLFKHRRGKAWACGLRRSPPNATLARTVWCRPLCSLGTLEKRI